MTHRYLVLLSTAFLMAITACGGRTDNPWAASADGCRRHDQCGNNQACVFGVCEGGRLDETMSVEDINGALLFSEESGFCNWDSDCGPWACADNNCVSPESAGRELLSRGSYRYYDASCQSHEDCGEWFCANGWCHAPGTIGPDAETPLVSNGTGTGSSCLGDDTCDGECIYPGYCHEGRGDEPMSFLEIDGRFTTYGDHSCNYDTDCGPEVCFEGWCMTREFAGAETRTRADYRYFDASCAEESDCRGWTCVDGWCEDPSQIGVYKGDEDASTEAAVAYRSGTLSRTGEEVYDVYGTGGIGITGTGTGGGGAGVQVYGTGALVGTGAGSGSGVPIRADVDEAELEAILGAMEAGEVDHVFGSGAVIDPVQLEELLLEEAYDQDIFLIDSGVGVSLPGEGAAMGVGGLGTGQSEDEDPESNGDSELEDPPPVEHHPVYAVPDEETDETSGE